MAGSEHRRRKVNLPLIEVIIISLVLHIAVLLVLGGLTVYSALLPERAELEAPPEPPQQEPQRLEQQVRMQQQQQRSTRPRQQISVANPSQLNLPSMDIDMPAFDLRVAVGTGTGAGAGGMGRDFGRGGIDFSRSAVNFFGIQSQGERIIFIVDASDHMLVDEKGGIPAYEIIKQEITRMVNELSPGTLFNVLFYRGRNVMAFSDRMLPATREHKERFATWIQPINKDYASRGNIRNDLDIEHKDIRPMFGDVGNWVRAVQVAMEQGADNINLLVASWQWHRTSLEADALARWYRDRGWGDREEEIWRDAVEKARAWLNNENRARREQGVPERVVTSYHSIIREELGMNIRHKPAPNYTPDEIIDYVSRLGHYLYRDRDTGRPPLNIVVFLGSDEEVRGNSSIERFNQLIRRTRGRQRTLEGLPALENVTGRTARRG